MNEVKTFLTNELDLKENDYVIVAVSGGPDSMALLHLISQLKNKININVVCAHVNHNMRKESEEEAVFVEDFCKQHGVIFEYMKIEDYGNDNFHNEARTKRYMFFEKLIEKYNAKYLFTAHHGDDLIETILMRIVRGSTLRGYAGFGRIVNRDTYKIARPLMTVTKKDIYEYLFLNNIDSREDSSNKKDVYTRNRYRKYIVPKLKEESKEVHYKFYKFSQMLLEYSNYVDKIVKEQFNKIYQNNTLQIDEFKMLDKLIGQKIIDSIFEEIYEDDLMLITDRHVELIYNLITSSKSNSEVYLPNNIRAIKSYNILQFKKDIRSFDNYEMELAEVVLLPNNKKISIVTNEDTDSNFVCRLSKEDVVFPLYVRNRKSGDKMEIKGLNGHKKIKDIFINEKINLHEREEWPVVVDGEGKIVWLPGLKKSKFDKTKKEKYDIILKYN